MSEVHPTVGVRQVAAWENQYQQHLRLPRATAEVGGLFAGVAVLTAAGGLFSLLTYVVGLRRREFGIRTALRASPRQMGRLVFRNAAAVVVPGVAGGAIGGWFVARSLAAFQYGCTTDPVIWGGVATPSLACRSPPGGVRRSRRCASIRSASTGGNDEGMLAWAMVALSLPLGAQQAPAAKPMP